MSKNRGLFCIGGMFEVMIRGVYCRGGMSWVGGEHLRGGCSELGVEISGVGRLRSLKGEVEG